jgi:hypothetical protein
MNFNERIEKIINKKNSKDSSDYANFVCVKEFNWSYSELMKTPIPFVLAMLEQWKKMKEAEKKASRRRK